MLPTEGLARVTMPMTTPADVQTSVNRWRASASSAIERCSCALRSIAQARAALFAFVAPRRCCTWEAERRWIRCCRALRAAAQSSVQQIQNSGELVQLAVSDALQTESALGSIAAAVSLIQQMNQQIAAAAEEQSSVAEEINRSVTSIRASADQSSIAMRGNAASSVELAQLGSELRGMVGHFRL